MRFVRGIAAAACAFTLLAGGAAAAQAPRADLAAEIDRGAAAVEERVVAWRRDIHAHPELSNRIPDTVELLGTIRSLDPEQRRELHAKVESTAVAIASSAGAEADVKIRLGYPITWNDPALAAQMRPTLERIAGRDRVVRGLPRTGAEDFAFFAAQVPGLYIWLGIRPADIAAGEAAPNHSPHFFLDEGALLLGVRSMAGLAVDFLTSAAAARD